MVVMEGKYRHINLERRKIKKLLLLGILALALRQRNINHDLFASTGFKRMISAVNTVALEQFGANSVLQCDGLSTPNVERTNLSTTDIVEAAEISPPEKK